ncbi:MAG: hypothetical protein LBQ66_13485 [Planctomycetaceae bacterium]|nr:hypothetical protein [Planctomycetaceae bacterium]
MAFRSNFFGAITHRGGRDARVPVRRRFAAIVGLRRRNRLAVGCPPYVDHLTLTTLRSPTHFPHLWDKGKPRPYNVNVF